MSSNSSIEGSDKENSTPNTVRTLQGLKKRVVFSPLPALLQPSVQSQPSSVAIPQRSVLKATDRSSSPLGSPEFEVVDPLRGNNLYMIESAIRCLSGTDRASKLDTYTTLSTIFRSFKTLPDRAQLLNRIAELFECVANDVTRLSEENPGTPDVPLNTKALKVAGFLMYEPEIAAVVPAKLARALIEHSLGRMEVDKATKATSTQALWLWQTQQLPRSVVTPELAERMLLASLKVDYPSIVINQERMSVFLRLLEQARDTMVRHVERWLPLIINYLLDDNKQIRTSALRTALEAGKQLCRVPSVGRCVQNHLKSQINGRAYIQVTSDRFKTIMQEPEGGNHVAHAWGAICTLSSSQNPERSRTLMDWMHVLSIVFNSSSTDNKVMAQSAWVRMIHYFGNNGDIIYRDKNLSYLTKPMCRMLSHEVKVYDVVRMAAVNTVCSLLYALVRPTTSQPQLTSVWDEVIVPVCTAMLEQHQKESLQQRAVDILTALFEHKSLPSWALDRLLDGTVGTEDEITQLDPRWVKANANKIGPLITLALQSTASRGTKVQLWTAVQRSLRLASAKEIQISAETMEATAAVCTIFREIWRAALPNINSPSSRIKEDITLRPALLTDLVLVTFEHFGVSSFTERTLSFYDDSDEITPASTPSIHDAGAPERGTGLKFVFRLFQNPISETLVVPGYFELLAKIVERAVTSQKSLRKSLSLLSQCQACMLMEGTALAVQSWKVLAEVATAQLKADNEKTSSVSSPAFPLAADTDERWTAIRNMLMFGIQMQRDHPASQEWLRLADAGLQAIEKQHGPSAIAHKLVDRLVETLACLDVKYMLEYVQFFLYAMKSSKAHSKTSTLILPGAASRPEPAMLYEMLNRVLLYQATEWHRYKLSGHFAAFLDTVCAYLLSTPEQESRRALTAMMPGLVAWSNRVVDGAKHLMLTVLELIGRLKQEDLPDMMSGQQIFVAVFPCSDVSIRRATIETWNKTFGALPRLEYDPELVEAIETAQLSMGTITLPTWPNQDPEVSESVSQEVSRAAITNIAAPQINALTETTEMHKNRRRSRSTSAMPGVQTRSQRSSIVSEAESIDVDAGRRKRKRRGTMGPGIQFKGSAAVVDLTVPLNDETEPESEASDVSGGNKRRRGPQRINHKTPAVKNTRRLPSKDPMAVNPEDDVFSSPGAAGTFTLRKRNLRNLSPDVPSDPISESSPSVHSRLRKLSSSQEPPYMGELRLSARETSPVLYEDPMPSPEYHSTPRPIADEEEDEIASPLPKAAVSSVTSDDLMQLQIQDNGIETAIVQEAQEFIDEDLFIMQLEQYRASLNSGRPITPRRRERLGVLMKQITKLSGDVTEAYFSA